MFKSTGVIRKIDDLGRIVLPKEFRRKYKLEDGTRLYLDGTVKSVRLMNLRKTLSTAFRGLQGCLLCFAIPILWLRLKALMA